MKRQLVGMLVVMGWAVAAAVGQEPPVQGEGKEAPGARPAGDPARMMGMFGTMRALHRIAGDLNEEQKAKLDKAQNEMSEKMKKACEEFEADLAGILTAEEMQKYKTARESAGNWGGRGMGGPGQMGPGLEIFKTFRALATVENELSEEQKAKLKKVCESVVEKMQEDLEMELGNILTANQMERFKKAKESNEGPGGGEYPRGRFGRRGPGQAQE